MTAIDFLWHLLGFLAPAFALALLMPLAARLALPRGGQKAGWRTCLAINFAVGAGVLLAGLWVFGRDGKMATYAAMVLAVATAQWLAGRGWRA